MAEELISRKERNEILKKLSDEEVYKRFGIAYKVGLEYAKRGGKTASKISIHDFRISYFVGDDGKIHFTPYVSFCVTEPVSYDFFVSEEDVLKKAKEFGVPEKLLDINYPGHDFIIRTSVVHITGYEKMKIEPRILEDVVEAILNRAKELSSLIEGRSKAKLEEVS